MSNIPILLDHDDFVIINKPIGIAVQNEEHQRGLLPVLCKQTGHKQYYLVHRLDKVTSGLLILAKHASSAAHLSQLFAKRKIQKYYLALSRNKPKKKQGCVAGDMKKVRDGKWMLIQQFNNPAVTQFFSYSAGIAEVAGLRLFILKPYTGKTHQLRVVLKSLGSPILGDSNYTGDDADRTYLHAYALEFDYQGKQIRVIAPLYEGQLFNHQAFGNTLQQLPLPWELAWPELPARLTQ